MLCNVFNIKTKLTKIVFYYDSCLATEGQFVRAASILYPLASLQTAGETRYTHVL